MSQVFYITLNNNQKSGRVSFSVIDYWPIALGEIFGDTPQLCSRHTSVSRHTLCRPLLGASGERSFSKLKLIKTYLRSTMTQERLSDLAILSIEKKLLYEVELEAVF